MDTMRKILTTLTAIFLLFTGCNDSESPVATAVEDRTPPDIWWTAPEGGVTLQATVMIQLSYFDEVEVDSVRLIRNGTLVETFIPNGNVGVIEYLWDTTSDSDGVHIWEARAWDDFGNMGQSLSLLLRVQNSDQPRPGEDVTPPVIVWLSPTPGDTLTGAVNLRFQVMDDSRLDSVQIYLNGQLWQNFKVNINFYDGNVMWITFDWSDRNYIIQVKAFDALGNVGLSEVIWFAVWNNRPRVIWVPDEFELIQDAIWASEDGDTIMVRAGEYRESLQMFDKNVSLISESGPEETMINSSGLGLTLGIAGGQDTTMIVKGFKFYHVSEVRSSCIFVNGSSPVIVNNIFTGPDSENTGIVTGENAGIFRNNLFINMWVSTQMATCWGEFINNMIINVHGYGFWNATIYGQPLIPDYNLFWDYADFFNGNYDPIEWGENNQYESEPIFEEDSYRLREGSPGIDQGRPDLSDPDGSRSDIGVYGGPYAY